MRLLMMNRRQSLKALSLSIVSSSVIPTIAASLADNYQKDSAYTTYLMVYFMENDQKLYYAYSRNAQDWITLNNRKFVLDAKVDLRDPYIARVKDTFHLVHTHGWDYPDIYHWQSKDLIHWEGGAIQVVSADKKR